MQKLILNPNIEGFVFTYLLSAICYIT